MQGSLQVVLSGIATIMRKRRIVLVAIGLLLLAGCANPPRTSDIAVRVGMSREDLRLHFGEPLRIDAQAGGAEDWYYHFAQWETYPTGGRHFPKTLRSSSSDS